MSNHNNRKRLISKYDHLYEPLNSGYWRDSSCAYCGNFAESRDHVPALSWLDTLGTDYFSDRQQPLVTVPSCLECNTALGDQRLLTLSERSEWLLDHYRQKYKKLLDSGAWIDEELGELDGRLQETVSIHATQQLAAKRRIGILGECRA